MRLTSSSIVDSIDEASVAVTPESGTGPAW